jgi:predicted GTPase
MTSPPSGPPACRAPEAQPADRVARARRVLILGAAGRDFHNFNVVFRDDPASIVVGFTASQIPGIAGRRYPSSLAGSRYPQGIPIGDESDLEALCRTREVDEVVFAYSDVPHEHVMHLASRALSVGADFVLLGPDATMLRSSRPVIAITAVRTGCGKSQIARWLSRRLRERGMRVAVLRHPMSYGAGCSRSHRHYLAAAVRRAGCHRRSGRRTVRPLRSTRTE